MTQAASDRLELMPAPQHAPSRGRARRAPMFGHRPVGWGRHGGAVFGAAFVSSIVQALLGVATAVIAMRLTGGDLGQRPILAVAIGSAILWMTMFPIVLGQVAIFFTAARTLLTLARQNFGAAYLAVGLVLGMVEASALGMMRGAMLPRDFMFAAATGMLSGFVYWLIASRDRNVVAAEAHADTAAAFR